MTEVAAGCEQLGLTPTGSAKRAEALLARFNLPTRVTRDELLHLVWGYSDAPLTRTVDNFIFRLRHKLEPDPRHPIYIRKAYGDGYRLIIE